MILEGGVDLEKACRIPAFAAKITDPEGFAGADIVEAGMLEGRRALLAHAAETLINEHGAELVNKEEYHGSTVDELYVLKVGGLVINLHLMPR